MNTASVFKVFVYKLDISFTIISYPCPEIGKDFEKMQKVGNKILMQHALWENQNRRAKILKRFLSAISPDGLHTLSETIQMLGKNIILLEDRWMIAAPFLNYIERQLSKRGIDHIG